MFWPLLALVAVVAAVWTHLRWRSRVREAGEAAQAQQEMADSQRRASARQLELRQQALFDSMVEGLLLLDQQGKIRLVNRAFATLFAVSSNVVGKTILEAVRSHELAELVECILSEKQVSSFELKLATPTDRWLEANSAAIFDAQGRRDGSILVFHDLTRLKQLESARKEFVANVSHELRTPLSLIKGYAETLLDGAIDKPEVARKFLQTIDRNAERLRLLIEDLLTISELESGRVKLDLRPVDLKALVEKILADFKARADERSVTLKNTVPHLTVRGDSDRLEQVVGNLIENAIKYGRQGSHVTVGARETEGALAEIQVADDGPGIPAESLHRVFERFYRVDKARSREQGGTGLGLSIVKHLVQSHDGTVWAESEPGRGATFYFTLPLFEDRSRIQTGTELLRKTEVTAPAEARQLEGATLPVTDVS